MYDLSSPGEIVRSLGTRARARRLALGLVQAEVAARAGISVQTLKRFENGHSGVSLLGFVGVARALDDEPALANLFAPPPPERLEDVLAPRPRLRASRRGRAR